MSRNIYLFEEGSKEMKNLLGGKGANLAEMTNMGLPVPGGFTITTEACNQYLDGDEVLSKELLSEMEKSILVLEEKSGKKMGNVENPMLVSVRSGAVFSMPGMMDTILNLGLNDETVEGLSRLTGDARFSYDCYRRLLQMFGDVVYGIDNSYFEEQLTYLKEKKNYAQDSELSADDWKEITDIYKELYLEKLHKPFPQDPQKQLTEAVEAVFRSWRNPRANIYRNLNSIPHDLGTAVNIQLMVFGNSGDNSGTGVVFTRNPSNGENLLFGEYLINAQGEDVVAGVRTPEPISKLEAQMPKVFKEFNEICKKLELHYKDMQDIEFTVENGELFILQTRNGKRTPKAAFQIATDLYDKGFITKEEAIMKIDPEMVGGVLHPVFDPTVLETKEVIASGLPASPGAASGMVCFHSDKAKLWHDEGKKVILVRQETSPEDIEGMISSEAIVTSRGGMTSHAAVVARGMGTCCVAGSDDLDVQEELRIVRYGDGKVINEGDIISVDGTSGKIYLGEIPSISGEEDEAFSRMIRWAESISRMEVRANADTPDDYSVAFGFGATGVGLTRTEHMFFGGERLVQMRKLIIAENAEERKAPIKALLKIQTEDFANLYRVSKEKPVTVRLLDPPLHEFLPANERDIATVAKDLGVEPEYLKRRVSDLREVNPMLGHRGCRLAVTYPEIYEMQTEAIINAVIALQKENINVTPEIMIPLICEEEELVQLRKMVHDRLLSVKEKAGAEFDYEIGTMIEIPRACLMADKIAKHADFFSFGTNDLTQMAFGFSRDDTGKFIGQYLDKKILPFDPFISLDIDGVGELIKIAIERGRKTKPNLQIGVCGEVGGDPSAIKFFNEVGLDYVSCSPYRVPVAKIAAARATIESR